MDVNKLSIQEFLSLGYIFLLLLGISYQTIYFSFFDINYLKYSSILDVLLSPLQVMTENIIILGTFLFIILFAVLYVKTFGRKLYQWQRRQGWYKKFFNVERWDKMWAKENSNSFAILYTGILILIIFIEFGFIFGSRMSSLMESGKLEIRHEIVFVDTEEKSVRILNQNSLYLFYVVENENKLTISPIDGNIKKISKLK